MKPSMAEVEVEEAIDEIKMASTKEEASIRDKETMRTILSMAEEWAEETMDTEDVAAETISTKAAAAAEAVVNSEEGIEVTTMEVLAEVVTLVEKEETIITTEIGPMIIKEVKITFRAAAEEGVREDSKTTPNSGTMMHLNSRKRKMSPLLFNGENQVIRVLPSKKMLLTLRIQ